MYVYQKLLRESKMLSAVKFAVHDTLPIDASICILQKYIAKLPSPPFGPDRNTTVPGRGHRDGDKLAAVQFQFKRRP